MFDEISIILQIVIMNLIISFISSYIAVSNDIRNYNNKLLGKNPDAETTVFTLRYYRKLVIKCRYALFYPLLASVMLLVMFYFYSYLQNILMLYIIFTAVICIGRCFFSNIISIEFVIECTISHSRFSFLRNHSTLLSYGISYCN